jgi:N-acetyl-anhydromuramyl-L-alanine amidase AmpD
MADPALIQQVTQLQAQQAAISAGLQAVLEARWLAADFGANSLEAILYGLNPNWQGQISAREPLYNLPEPPPGPEPNVVWIGSPNHYTGRAGWPVVALVIHTMAGTLEGCDSWFQNPASQVSSHYGIGLGGEQHQYVKLSDGSWANGILEPGNDWTGIVGNSANPNYQTVTVETEDNGSGATAVTDEQYNGTLAVCRLALQTYPSIKYLMGHDVISPSSRSQCCGHRWWDSGRFAQLADALGLEAWE